MKNIYLVGFMGSGKTTVGEIIAARLNKNFIEMDAVIEENEGKKIADIFKVYGEAYFRRLEKELLKKISKKKDLVVSCGGGLVCDADNLKIIKESGIVFNLYAPAKILYERTKRYKCRPLLNVKNPLAAIKDLLKKREPFYNQANYSIDTKRLSPVSIAAKIIKVVNEY